MNDKTIFQTSLLIDLSFEAAKKEKMVSSIWCIFETNFCEGSWERVNNKYSLLAHYFLVPQIRITISEPIPILVGFERRSTYKSMFARLSAAAARVVRALQRQNVCCMPAVCPQFC